MALAWRGNLRHAGNLLSVDMVGVACLRGMLMRVIRHRVQWLGLLLPVLMAGAAAASGTADRAGVADIAAAAQRAHDTCNELMHDNADEFDACLDALDAEVTGKAKGKSKEVGATRERLGLAYFGWLGATQWGRTGMPGADEAALKFYWRFLPLQRKLKLSDEQMCAVMAGDCKVRQAQLLTIAGRAQAAKATGKADAAGKTKKTDK